MELTPKQQTTQAIVAAQKILVLTHVGPDGDGLGSLLALFLVLKKLGKDVTAVAPEQMPLSLGFLPSIDILAKSFNMSKDFIITVNTAKTKVDRLGYKHYPEENKLNIVITPLGGSFSSEDVSFNLLTANIRFSLYFAETAPIIIKKYCSWESVLIR